MRLSSLQAAVSAALQASGSRTRSGENPPAPPELAQIIEHSPGASLNPGDRIAIYRNNSLAVRCSALVENFPAVHSLVGAEYFDAAARRYARNHPAQSADLNQYGVDFADFLGELPDPGAQLPYLRDVARYEWMRSELQHAAGASEGETALRVLTSPHPILEIYAIAIQRGDLELENSDEPELNRILLYRDSAGVQSRVIDEELYARLHSEL
ncbi:MAG: DNA-binding domain-containing protein [bacterium]|nr:DNA-binding domain-containing protein [bacterium]